MNIITKEKYLLALYFQRQLHAHGRFLFDFNQVEALLIAEVEQQQIFLKSALTRQEEAEWASEFARLQDLGVNFSIYADALYPRSFLRMDCPPFVISFLGKPIWCEKPGLAVVGSREISSSSVEWMEINLSAWLKEKQGYLVSGGARGVDQKAHELCLRHQVPTVAVIPSGVGNIYPRDLASWVKPIVAQGGAVVSEYPYSQEMRKHFFQARNRLISGLAVCTLVIQAARKSGTQMTARLTLEQGRPVLVVPSHPLALHHRGGLDLIIEGATPIRDAEDLKMFFCSESSLFRPRFPQLVGEHKVIH